MKHYVHITNLLNVIIYNNEENKMIQGQLYSGQITKTIAISDINQGRDINLNLHHSDSGGSIKVYVLGADEATFKVKHVLTVVPGGTDVSLNFTANYNYIQLEAVDGEQGASEHERPSVRYDLDKQTLPV